MTILLLWLVEHAWIFYAVCAIGAAVYVARALSAHRERSLALFTLERETATAQAVQAWAMVLVFVAIGVAIFVGTTFILPGLSIGSPENPLPTSTPSSGVELLAPGVTPSPTVGSLVPTVTPTPTATSAPASTSPPPGPTDTVAPEPTDAPAAAISGEVHVGFGDFAELTGYELLAAEVTTAQPLPLTLYWRGREGSSPSDYLVFTHLLSGDGRLIAQHDGVPANGTRPTTGWIAGETVVDPHAMIFQDTAYTGPARIAVGLYDSATGRVTTQTGADHVVLPITIIIVPQ